MYQCLSNYRNFFFPTSTKNQKIISFAALSYYCFDKTEARFFINFLDIWKIFGFVFNSSEISSHYPIRVISNWLRKNV